MGIDLQHWGKSLLDHIGTRGGENIRDFCMAGVVLTSGTRGGARTIQKFSGRPLSRSAFQA
jgi:hypothetical protein